MRDKEKGGRGGMGKRANTEKYKDGKTRGSEGAGGRGEKGAANNWPRSKPELRSFFLATEPENPFMPTQD